MHEQHPALDEATLRGLPGSELVLPGLSELSRGEETEGALLVAMGASRLRRAGLVVPDPGPAAEDAELKLYALLRRLHPDDAYGRYNALVRRFVAFEQNLEQLAARRAR